MSAAFAVGLMSSGCGSGAITPAPAGRQCTGDTPAAAAFSATPGPLRASDDGCGPPLPDGGCSGAGCMGSALPRFALNDVNPRSCGYKAAYGPDLYRGKVVFLALWAGW